MNKVELDGLNWHEILHAVDQALGQLLGEQPRKAPNFQLVLDLGSRPDASVIAAALAVHVKSGSDAAVPGVALALSLSSFSGSPVLLVAQQLDVLKQLWGDSMILSNDADAFGEEVLAAMSA